MLKRIAFLVCLVLAATVMHAAPASETPALHVFRQWLDAFNSGDASRITAFWQQYGKQNADEHVASDMRLRNMTGGMSIFRVEEDTDAHLLVLMKETRGSWSESTLDLASINPPVIGRIGGHPVPPPEGAVAAAASDSDLAERVNQHIAQASGPDAYSGAVLVAHNGQIAFQNAWGMADIQRQI